MAVRVLPDHCARAPHGERLVALGATVEHRFVDHTWLLDPEGNDFCVTDTSGPRAALGRGDEREGLGAGG